jgi:hypothetical protein
MRAPAVALTFASCLLLVSCSSSKLPKIKDPETLRKDCAVLFQQFPLEETDKNSPLHEFEFPFRDREIPTEKWPTSIQALHPLKVTRDKYAICIWILPNTTEQSKNWVFKGYYVLENHNASPPRIAHGGGGEFNLQSTDYHGIDIFYLPAAVL